MQDPTEAGPAALKKKTQNTIVEIVRQHAHHAPHAPAFVEEGKEPLTYGELVRVVDSIRERLNDTGFGRGDRIAIVAPTGPAVGVLITGIVGCAAAVPLNPALSLGEFAIYLRDLKVKAVAIDVELDTQARTAARDIGLPILEVEHTGSGVAGMIDIRSTGCPGKSARPGPAQSDDLALALLTSGTTSHSKIVPVTQRQLVLKTGRYVESQKLTAADRHLSLMPMCYGHGIQGSLFVTLYSGGSLIMLPEFSTDGFFRMLGNLRPTWYAGSFTFQHAIHAAAPGHTEEIAQSKLRFIRASSGHLDRRIVEGLEEMLHAPVMQPYACTEVSGICAPPFPPGLRKPGTVGVRIHDGVQLLGPDNSFVGPGEHGEVVVRCSEVFSGYENDPAANAESLIDGWFHTGDEGVFDEDGYLTLTGRIKDLISRGGEKVSPLEVDDALTSHPDVVAAATFPLPHPTLGQEVAAAVVPAKGAVVSDEILVSYLRGRLAPFKVPRRIVIVDEIPKNASEKISRRDLANAFGLTEASEKGGSEPEFDRPPTALEEDLQRIWTEVLGVKRVGLNEDFFILGGDSLQAVDLFLEIEKALGLRLPRSVLFEAGTVAKMAQCIEQFTSSPCLVPIQPKGHRAPFFCVHDGVGEVLNYRELARLVGEAQPFYGIQCRGLDKEGVPFTRIEDMAAHYIGEIKKVQPTGPYFIGGYSFGGRVAYVMAQQLHAAGERVALLALIDAPSGYGHRRVSGRDWLAYQLKRTKSLPVSRLPAYFWLRATNLAGMIHMGTRIRLHALAWRFFESGSRPVPRFLRSPVPANDMIRRRYQARPYAGDATLFKAELFAWNHADVHEGWRELIKGKLEIRPIPGSHYDIVKQPHVRVLAAELANALEKANEASTNSGAKPPQEGGAAIAL